METIPIVPFLKTNPGMMPTLASPGVITPGQFGPIKVTPRSFTYCLANIISFTGIPSVIAIITFIPASAASIIESAAKAGGTNIIETSAPVFSIASFTVLKTGLAK